MKKTVQSLILMSLFVFLSACENSDQTETAYQPKFSSIENPQSETYILGVHPLHNPKKLYEVFTPLANYLSQELQISIKIEASKDYPNYDQKLKEEKFHFALPNPFQTINSLKYNYEVVNQVGDQSIFKGLILVRKDSQIKEISDLKNQTIAYPAPTALAATMMPQYYLQTRGLDLKSQTKTIYVGSQESSIMNVYLKNTQASATWPVPWQNFQQEKPNLAKDLKIAWETTTLPSNSFTYHRQKVSESLGLKVQTLLSNLHTHETGQKILQNMNIQEIFTASNTTYQPVVEFVENFQQVVGDNSQFH